MTRLPSILRVITHYAEDDPDFRGDYLSVDLFDGDGRRLIGFRDHYHDKGEIRVESFVDGLQFARSRVDLPPAEVTYERVADGPPSG